GVAVAQPTHVDPAALRDRALQDDTAWTIVRDLTTEIGPRLAGTDAEARARDWAMVRLRSLGFKNIRIEPFEIEGWQRGIERGEVLQPFPQPLVLTALGRSGATLTGGLSGEVMGFGSVAELEAAPAAAIRGKIVFVWHRMGVSQDGSSYGAFHAVRTQAPAIAAGKGAMAVLIRSVGTSGDRFAHAGATRWPDGQKPIPAAALSVPDAEQLERMLSTGKSVSVKLTLTPRFTGKQTSGHVIAEIPGRDPDAGMVLIGGHLDSWDLGTGAIDDAAGVAITAAAARLVGQAGTPLRTVRLVWFGSEEFGPEGAEAFYEAHRNDEYVVAAESDFGADRIWKLDTRVSDPTNPAIQRLESLLRPLGIARGNNEARGGADISPFRNDGTPIVSLTQDGTRYFDLHHTANDTLDKVDSSQLRQNVAAWVALLAVAANDPEWPKKPDIQRKTAAK
ncbi:MAG: M20/M25/M40 family metallo-hydrolase, partial [Sphingomonadaceae bacterium]